MAPDPDNEISLSRAAAAIRIAARSRQDDWLDQTPIVVLDVAAASIVAAAVFNRSRQGSLRHNTRDLEPERCPGVKVYTHLSHRYAPFHHQGDLPG